jgi:hypothetical protein
MPSIPLFGCMQLQFCHLVEFHEWSDLQHQFVLFNDEIQKVLIMVASIYTFILFNNFHNQMALHVASNRIMYSTLKTLPCILAFLYSMIWVHFQKSMCNPLCFFIHLNLKIICINKVTEITSPLLFDGKLQGFGFPWNIEKYVWNIEMRILKNLYIMWNQSNNIAYV